MYFLTVAALAILEQARRLDNGLARTPPMGWLSWEQFRCDLRFVNADLYKRQAERMAQDGYLAAGYEFVNVDDCWSHKGMQYTQSGRGAQPYAGRDAAGNVVADPERFPEGILGLSRFVHGQCTRGEGGERCLKFGFYSSITEWTCERYPGLKGHFEKDAHTFASWEIDMLKVDGCGKVDKEFEQDYATFGKLLAKEGARSGRPILYSCSWPAYLGNERDHGRRKIRPDNATLVDMSKTCNIWRNYGDIENKWETVMAIIQYWDKPRDDIMVSSAGPGHFNDPDMLVVGSRGDAARRGPGLTLEQERTQFALWAIFAAPLLMSADLTLIGEESRAILLNRDIIAVNQDPLGQQGWHVDKRTPSRNVWVRPLTSGRWAVAFTSLPYLSSANDRTSRYVDFAQHLTVPGEAPTLHYRVRELYTGKDLGVKSDAIRSEDGLMGEIHMLLLTPARVVRDG